jgi:hypothetical protein
MEHLALLDPLIRAGYRVRLEGEGTWRCSIEDPSGGCWTGLACTPGEAVESAFSAMVPTAIARESLLAAWAGSVRFEGCPMQHGDAETEIERQEERDSRAVEPGVDDPLGAPSTDSGVDATCSGQSPLPPEGPSRVDEQADSADPLPVSEAVRPTEGESPPAPEESVRSVGSSQTDLEDSEREAGAGGAVPEPSDSSSESSPDTGEESGPTPGGPEPAVVESQYTAEEALERLEAQKKDILAAIPDLDGLSPQLIQLILLHWVARMRYVEECCPESRAVHERGHEIARIVQGQAFHHWPGYVPALQLEAMPGDCRATLTVRPEDEPLDCWQKVSVLAERELSELETSRDLDANGWGDQAALDPPPNAPDALLEEVAHRFEKLSRDWRGEHRLPREEALRGPKLRGALDELARKIRWLRGCVEDVETWGRVIGSLRRVAEKRKNYLPELASVLDPAASPKAGTWARSLGQNPRKKIRQREIRRLYEERPERDSDPESVKAWFIRAVELEIDQDRIRHHLRPHRSVVESWTAADFPGQPHRRTRRLVPKLQSHLSDAPDPEQEAVLESEYESCLAGAKAEPAVPEDPQARRRARVLPAIRNQRVLFITNRADPNLQRTLQEQLEPKDLDWLIAEARKVDAAAEAIAGGKYDLVLCATGFVGHSSERVIRTACERADRVPYIRAYKGRYASVLRSIERDLGLEDRRSA